MAQAKLRDRHVIQRNCGKSLVVASTLLLVSTAFGSDHISIVAPALVTAEDTSVLLGVTVDPNLLSSGTIPDTIGTQALFREANAIPVTAPVVGTIPADTSVISITAFSTQPLDTILDDSQNDDYQILSATIDINTGTSSGKVTFSANNTDDRDDLDQYSWQSVPLGQSVLSDLSKVTGSVGLQTSDPLFSIVGNTVEIEETHSLETAYLIEYQSSDADSSTFTGSESALLASGDEFARLPIPGELEPATGRKGLINISGIGAMAVGATPSNEYKALNRLVIDLDTGMISGVIAAEQGETEARTVTYAFTDYPLVDLRSSSATPVSVLSMSSAAAKVGDITGNASVIDDPTIYIDATGELVIGRSATFRDQFVSMYTAEYYERTGSASIAKTLSVESDNAFFEANPADNVDDAGKPIDELLFSIPADARVGIFKISWNTGHSSLNENMGVGHAVIDLDNSTSSGSIAFVRTDSPDFLSWNSVPLGSTFFGANDGSGNDFFESNRSAGGFIDPYPELAEFSIIDNADGTRTLKFEASSPVNAESYQGNGQVIWIGNQTFEVSGLPLQGSLSHGRKLLSSNWEVELEDLPLLAYNPTENVSGLDNVVIKLLSTDETETISISIEPVADTATLTADDVQGYSNTSIPLPIALNDSLDIDGSESFSTLELSNIPTSVTLSASAGTVSDLGGGIWSISAAALPSLTATATQAITQSVSVSVDNVDAVDIDADGTIEDGNNGSGVDERDALELSDSFTLTINSVPTTTAGLVSVPTNTVATLALANLIQDGDNDQDLSTIDLNQSTPGIQNTLSDSDGTWSVNNTGVLSFVPNDGFYGVATISFSVEDVMGNESNVSPVNVTVVGATPIVTADSASVDADMNATIDLSDNISDANDNADISTIDLNPAISGNQDTITTADGVWSVNTAGVLTFDPVIGFEGIATIPYTVEDDDGNESLPADVSVTVGGASPVADADTATTTQGATVLVDVLSGDTDANADIDPSTLDLDPHTAGLQSSLSVPGEGIYTVVGTQVQFEPIATFIGTSAIVYTVSDENGNVSNTANISIAVDASPDTDDDGIPDISDLDDDNDGIPDSVEGTIDTDEDGIIDSLDLDADNDGITDTQEAGGTDTDSDGIIDGFTDANLDGLDDAVAAAPLPVGNTDQDAQPDYRDIDSDNDGLSDAIEAGATDNNSDGHIDDFVDSDGNGLADALQTDPLSVTDTDVDGTPDYQQLDSDNDGIPDLTEAGGVDSDGNGIVDNFVDNNDDGFADSQLSSPLPINDSDDDGIPDYQELDSDADGIPDAIEAGSNPAVPTDTDGNGMADYQELDSDKDSIPDALEAGSDPQNPIDTNDDSIPDYQQLDSDEDGIPDEIEAGSDPLNAQDTDNDGTPDYQELDSDGDGVSDTIEAGEDPAVPIDSDGDGIPDYQQLDDSDGDGIPDAIEGSNDSDGDNVPDYLDIDSDNDGLLDAVEAGDNAVTPFDTDNDGIVDYLDRDSDNDGMSDVFEAGGDDVDGDGVVDNFSDANNDGHDDGAALVPFTDPDSDGDGFVDHLDLDSDNDGIPDVLESFGPEGDLDGDGQFDSALDDNGDGLADNAGVITLLDVDGDGAQNYLDLDSDNDGVTDLVEAGGDDVDNNGVVDAWADTDADGIPDTIDADLVTGDDLDNDGIVDFADADFVSSEDTDGDGIVDLYDDDVNGSGYAPFLKDQPLQGSLLPDTNGNGVPDVLEVSGAGDGIVHIGLSGSGCSIATNQGSLDSMMLLLSLLAATRIMMTRVRVVGLAVASMAVLLSSCASNGNDSVVYEDRISRSVYLGAGLGKSELEPDTSEVPGVDVSDSVSSGWQLTLGLDVNKHFSLELHTADLGRADLSPQGGINYGVHGASAVYYVGGNRHRFKRRGFTGYGRLGFGLLDSSAAGDVRYQEDNGSHFLIGAGLEYMTGFGLGIRAELISFEEDINYGQLGLIYRFGRKNEREIIEDEPIVAAPPVPVTTPEPIAVAPAVCTQSDGVLEGVAFYSDSEQLTTDAKNVLSEVAEKLKQCTGSVKIVSHTDSIGSDAYNRSLGERRAKSVAIYLYNNGIDLSRISARTYGELRPIDTNDTAEGRARNRRVEMIIAN